MLTCRDPKMYRLRLGMKLMSYVSCSLLRLVIKGWEICKSYSNYLSCFNVLKCFVAACCRPVGTSGAESGICQRSTEEHNPDVQ